MLLIGQPFSTIANAYSADAYHYDPSFTLTGSNYKDVVSSSSLQLSKFTVAIWFKTTMDVPSSDGLVYIVNKGGSGSEAAGSNMNYGIMMRSDEKIQAGFESSIGEDSFVVSPSSYNDGRWHYAVATFNGANTSINLYIDGQLVVSKTTGKSPDSSGAQPVRIGANSLQLQKYFVGSVDELRVWNRALTSTEVSNAYSQGTFGTTGQVLYLDFGTSSSPSDSSCFNRPISQYKAVNFAEKRMFAKEPRDWLGFSAPSIYDRLNEIKSHGYNAIRVPYSWEGYVKNPTAFEAGLNEVETAADKLSICVLYDFHQSYAGSRFNYWGIGFPSFLTKAYTADRSGELKFWSNYFDNAITYNGKKIWDLQFEFIRDDVVKNADSHPSTAGYEVINEPIVQTCDQFAKVGNLHTYILGRMRNEATQKPLFFENAVNQACTNWNDINLESQALPRGVTNLVYAPHIYNKNTPLRLFDVHLPMLQNVFQKQQSNMPMFIGEWGQHSGDGINQDIMKTYLKAFKENNVGWAYWVWDPLYDYACKTQSYTNTQYAGYLDNAMAAVY